MKLLAKSILVSYDSPTFGDRIIVINTDTVKLFLSELGLIDFPFFDFSSESFDISQTLLLCARNFCIMLGY